MNNDRDKEYDDYQMLTTKELAKLTGLGRDKAYALMNSHGFPAIKIGKSFRVTFKAYKIWADNNIGRTINI